MSLRDRIRAAIAKRNRPPATIDPETLALYFDNNEKWRLGPLSKTTGVPPEYLKSLLTRENGFACGAQPMPWYAYSPILKEACLESTLAVLQPLSSW